MRSRIEDIEKYFQTHGRLIAADIKWLIAKVKEGENSERKSK